MTIQKIGLGFADRDFAIRTIAGEASDQGQKGQAAIAWVIRNRAEFQPTAWWGSDVGGVCRKRAQFSCWNGGKNTDRVKDLATTDDEYRDAAEVLDAVMNGDVPDPTGGATTYKVRGTSASWDKAVADVAPVEIGDHDFWRLMPNGTCALCVSVPGADERPARLEREAAEAAQAEADALAAEEARLLKDREAAERAQKEEDDRLKAEAEAKEAEAKRVADEAAAAERKRVEGEANKDGGEKTEGGRSE